MDENLSSQTIPGSYTILKMETDPVNKPGIFEDVLCEKIRYKGKEIFVPVEARLAEQADFDKRFEGTKGFKPNDWDPQTTNPIVKVKASKIDKIDAHLGEVLGDPKRIIAQKGIDDTRKLKLKTRSQVATYIELIKISEREDWLNALPFIRVYYLTLGS